MDYRRFQLFINGKSHDTRGLDLACNPHNGIIMGKVILVSESLLHETSSEEDTASLTPDEIFKVN
jgi:hypothetical protein